MHFGIRVAISRLEIVVFAIRFAIHFHRSFFCSEFVFIVVVVVDENEILCAVAIIFFTLKSGKKMKNEK